jgi:hypothetical protein
MAPPFRRPPLVLPPLALLLLLLGILLLGPLLLLLLLVLLQLLLLLKDLEEDLNESDVKSLDQHLLGNFSLLSDAQELAQEVAKPPASASGSGNVSMACLSDASWYLSEVNHDVSKFIKMKTESESQQGMLAVKEKEFATSVAANVRQATEASFHVGGQPLTKNLNLGKSFIVV